MFPALSNRGPREHSILSRYPTSPLGIGQPDHLRSSSPKTTVEEVLAALCLVSVCFGPVLTVHVAGKSLAIYLAHLIFPFLFLALTVSFSKERHQKLPDTPRRVAGWSLLLISLALPPVLIAPELGSAAAAYFNFATGIAIGASIGLTWTAHRASRASLIDGALAVFLIASSSHLILSIGVSTDLTPHQAALTNWGKSNYVAGVLSVASLTAYVRARQHSPRGLLLSLSAGFGIFATLLTQSRGGVVALAAGLTTLLWQRGRRSKWGALALLGTILVPILGFVLVDRFTQLRSVENGQALANVDRRVELLGLAWSDFASNPIGGTGWTALRSSSFAIWGGETTFAHNSVVSFLQIGGIAFGIPIIWTIASAVVRSLRLNSPYVSSLVASVAISMTDPFFESLIANIFFWATVPLAVSITQTDSLMRTGTVPNEISGI